RQNAVFIKGISDEIEGNRKKLELEVASGKILESNANKQRIAFLTSKQYFREVSDFYTRTSKTEYFDIFGKIQNEIEKAKGKWEIIKYKWIISQL
ncbi:MAG: hypothetical protein NTV04_20950, partial [Deltaproteobacteria bacterium]|nr:hypothetical protein [Deltaproteobacteria bacterium]